MESDSSRLNFEKLRPNIDSTSSSSSSSSSASSSSSSSLSSSLSSLSVSSLQADIKRIFSRRRSEKGKGRISTSGANCTELRVKLSTTQIPAESLEDLILSPEKLLDKLLIVCPNSECCQEVFPKRELSFHLQHRCKSQSSNSIRWMNFRNYESNFMWGWSLLSPLPLAVTEGHVTSILIYRRNEALGIAIVGGLDTPLLNVVVQEIHKNGPVDRDGRLQPGDHLLEVNGIDLTLVNHLEAVRCLSCPCIVCHLVVYREPYDHGMSHHPKSEIFGVSLSKVPGEQLGIKLVQKKCLPGIYILDIIENSVAYWDDRLRPDDRILRINNIETVNGTQEQAVQIIQRSLDSVEFLISRAAIGYATESISMVTEPDISSDADSIPSACIPHSMPHQNQERTVDIVKRPSDPFGVTVAGGRSYSANYDTPVYVASLSTDAWLYASEQIMRGDILLGINDYSLLNRTQSEARQLITHCSDGVSQIRLRIVPGTETSDGPGNFRPSWKFWLSMPPCCCPVKTITLERSPSGSLGFSVVGGHSSYCGGTEPAFVKSVVRHGSADRDGRLRSGDRILAINEASLDSLRRGDVFRLLSSPPPSTAAAAVQLTVVSWPGSSI